MSYFLERKYALPYNRDHYFRDTSMTITSWRGMGYFPG